MSGRLSPDPEAAVSARYYGAVATEHLDRLARLAAAERERFARRWPLYRDRFLAATLAQGAALHMLTGSTGVKDLDVVLLFAALPGERFPEFPRLVKHVDFGPSSLGRQAYELAAARDDRQRRQWPGGPTSTGAAGWTWSSGRCRHHRGPTRWTDAGPEDVEITDYH
jgi:hypothetical protein